MRPRDLATGQEGRVRLDSAPCTTVKGKSVISKKAVALCATLGVALSGLAFVAPASADPVSNSYVIVGSDTLEDVVSALANGTNITGSFVRTTANGDTIGSFDATGSPAITTKPGGVRFGRPNGSGDGVKALSRSFDGAAYTSGIAGSPTNVIISNQVDIARSSSGGTVNANGELQYIPFGRDAIAFVYRGDAALASLTPAQLKALYECTNQVINGVTVTPIIPQAGSGTRKDFLAKIGTDEAGLKVIGETGGCAVEAQEHDATALTPYTNAVAPMAVSRWIAMNTGASYDRRGTATLGSPVSGVSPVTGTGTSMVPNATYYANSTWGRDTYLVVEYARLATDAGLAALVNPSISNSLTNSQTNLPTKAGSVKLKFGFLPPTSGLQPFRVAKS